MTRNEMGSCLRKKRFLSRKHAKDAASRAMKNGGARTRPYQCTFCGGGFHLTKEGA